MKDMMTHHGDEAAGYLPLQIAELIERYFLLVYEW
jgi:hypothetical protein